MRKRKLVKELKVGEEFYHHRDSTRKARVARVVDPGGRKFENALIFYDYPNSDHPYVYSMNESQDVWVEVETVKLRTLSPNDKFKISPDDKFKIPHEDEVWTVCADLDHLTSRFGVMARVNNEVKAFLGKTNVLPVE